MPNTFHTLSLSLSHSPSLNSMCVFSSVSHLNFTVDFPFFFLPFLCPCKDNRYGSTFDICIGPKTFSQPSKKKNMPQPSRKSAQKMASLIEI